jgi:ZIP family zinc transporter/zinc and cadmium transporter
MSPLWEGVLFAGIAALGNVIGGLVLLLRREWSQRSLKTSLAFGGGFMFAAAVLAMIPESLGLMPNWGPLLIVLGYMAVHFLEHVVGGHYHFAGDQHGAQHLLSTAVTGATLFAMFTHTFFDGVAIGSAFVVGERLGAIVFTAVILHKIPAGFAVSTVAHAGGASRGQAFAAAVFMGVGTVIGSVVLTATGPLARYAVPLSAGTLLHVAASDLIPEVNEGERWPITATVITGALVFVLLIMFMGPHLH